MYPYDDNNMNNNTNSQNNQYRHTPAGWDQDSGTYHYSYSQPTPPTIPEPPKKKKKGGAAKVAALVLCCALVGGGAGVGGAALLNHFTPPAAQSEDGTTIYRNDATPAPVKVVQADGLKEMSLEEIYASYADSCVCIAVQVPVTTNSYFGQQQSRMATGAGSGFIISEDGYIVTNYHVISGSTAIKVTLNNGEMYDAKLVGGEELNDVAVLKVDGVSGLKPVVLGDSDQLVVGEQVCTIGNALGTYSFSQTSGTVSAVGRSVTMSDGTVMNMIQTNCTINSGNSGGPLFDQYGRVVGITSAKLSNNGDMSNASIEGIGFAIPLNDVIGMIKDFMEYGYVTGRPYMGILEPKDIDQQAQMFGWPSGVYVKGIDEDSCAQKAGLKPGDIITKIDDKEITSVNQMVSVKNGYKAGDTVTLTVYRSGEYLKLELTFDEQTTEDGAVQGGAQEGNSQDDGSQNGSRQEGGNNYGDDYGDEYGSYGFDPWSYFFGNGNW